MSDDVRVVKPDAPRDVVSQQGPVASAQVFGNNTTFTIQNGTGPVVKRDSKCAKHGTHCWHDTGTVLTFYPGAAVERCCYCNVKSHRSLGVPSQPEGHGPFAPRTP